jgi:hypothetical protein
VALKPAMMRRALHIGLLGLLGCAVVVLASPAAQAQSRSSDDVARSSRPRVVIQPRGYRLPPNAKRECRAKLVQEYRVSGPVIVPQMTCWWE